MMDYIISKVCKNILAMASASERRRYIVTSSLIGAAHVGRCFVILQFCDIQIVYRVAGVKKSNIYP